MRKAVLGLCCLLLCYSVGAAHAQQALKVGLIMSFTGQFTDPATQMDNGIKLYMKQHGDTVAGRKLTLIRKDTAGAPDAAKRLAQELVVRDQVDISPALCSRLRRSRSLTFPPKRRSSWWS